MQNSYKFMAKVRVFEIIQQVYKILFPITPNFNLISYVVLTFAKLTPMFIKHGINN